MIGSIQDLSGPIAGFGKQARSGMLLRVDEINEQGGINGRKLKLLVEDSGYDPKKAVLAAQKLVNQDKIFIMLGHIGTAQNMAAMPVQFEKNVVNFFPLTAAREMYEPLQPAQVLVRGDLLRPDAHRRAQAGQGEGREEGLHDLPGRRVRPRGACAAPRPALKAIGMEFAEKTTLQARRDRLLLAGRAHEGGRLRLRRARHDHPRDHRRDRRGAQDRLQPDASSARARVYTDLIHKLGGKAMDGLYATMTVQNPYLDEASQPIRFWANKYKTKFNEDPTVFSVYGYIDHRHLRRGRRQGRRRT